MGMFCFTEAGKIALNIIKQQGLSTGETVLHAVGDEEKDEEVMSQVGNREYKTHVTYILVRNLLRSICGS